MNFENLHNYYETLVTDYLREKHSDISDLELLEDIACVALNQLPVRYIRHNVDFIFYMSPEERTKMEEQVQKAVKDAIKFVNNRNSG